MRSYKQQTADARQRLSELGERRAAQERARNETEDDIRIALEEAKRWNISKSEAARLLGLHRTTLYRVYGYEKIGSK